MAKAKFERTKPHCTFRSTVYIPASSASPLPENILGAFDII